ncbi:DUF6795 domain-containing protein [Vibrio campbellii]|uniref:DUF6795 domain-containing protein n=1 Tax=Vibrio campbellii TaxID=680 RepID=UPI0006ACAD6E|nr:DUF6795 domain-containing protein [Vibrio campbellii]NIY86981.1 DUF4198 domain-containing protein [Vibrio campbellii]NVK69408.1 hypothetical protein [Vibrio campbellii]OPH49420.1 hypothetical protein B4U81_20600 [Vibrio campbellii]
MAKRTLLILALALFSVGASAMFWPFKKYDVEMSPEVRGVIKLDGVPQAGLTVYRELYYEGYKKGKTLTDEARTNEYGEFAFDPVTVRSSAPGDIFGGSLRVHQKVFLNYNGEQKKLWGVWSPTDGRKPLVSMLSDINCELRNIERIHEVEIAPEKGAPISVYSVCDWNHERVTTYLYDEDSDTYIAKKDMAK